MQGDGLSYINLNFKANSYTEYDTKFQWLSGDYQYILGAQTSDSQNRFSLMSGTTSNRKIYCNNGTSTNEKTYTLTTTERNNTIIVKKVNNQVYINGTQRITFTNSDYTTPSTITLFCNHENSNLKQYFVGKIYYCKIDNLDLIPVRVGNVGYMYDKVSNRLFGNSGTGQFILGPDIN